MTPGARIAAAIDILDSILEGRPAEQALTGWARRSRFAGSKDRAAIRDHVFDALRRKRSAAAMGGGMSGRGLMLGLLRQSGTDPEAIFSGEGHAPAPIAPHETGRALTKMTAPEALDLPDWLWPAFQAELGADAGRSAQALRDRAPVFARVNLRASTISEAVQALKDDGIETEPHPDVHAALEVTANARRLRQSAAYLDGRIELQDANSQAIVQALPLRDGLSVLDYCAGGGGKTVAMGARADLELYAHDADHNRMRDLPARAERASLSVTLTALPDQHAPYDLVLCDVPCSGSGAWRRSPEGKWGLTKERWLELQQMQDRILDEAAALTRRDGVLVYATCSVLKDENEGRVAAFLKRQPEWICTWKKAWQIDNRGDGFFSAHLTRKEVVNTQL
ncbi:RsmB/NOP family class I SAM-dependent RNA methyltransferase [Thalassococcus sp. S3]|uniref:RsmB/NOP family class I SAM-dependent RNA methyltransferase n=1 Tax=Thalassococcus sp. S3 TaxID=2017482 RepID=UPI0010246CC7|nr:RsmB/NOP family class I SAM-dependent RNA methyltransferase [Thalassococcus sp. S3]QBF31789.1 SAM-dependent methyltransferase [Thalassococcus sp. S3]